MNNELLTAGNLYGSLINDIGNIPVSYTHLTLPTIA